MWIFIVTVAAALFEGAPYNLMVVAVKSQDDRQPRLEYTVGQLVASSSSKHLYANLVLAPSTRSPATLSELEIDRTTLPQVPAGTWEDIVRGADELAEKAENDAAVWSVTNNTDRSFLQFGRMAIFSENNLFLSIGVRFDVE